MIAYCKNCRQTHAVWNRLNDSAICGRCGVRVSGTEMILNREKSAASPNGHDIRPTAPKKRKSSQDKAQQS